MTIGSPASVLCACCDGACATCTAGSTLCDTNSAANTLKCCTANQCTGGPSNADANALSTGYNLCSAVTAKSGDTCVPVCAEGHHLVPSTGFTLQCDAPSLQYDVSGAVCNPITCTVANSDMLAGTCDCNPGYAVTAPGTKTINVAVATQHDYTFTCTANACTNGPTAATIDPNAKATGYATCATTNVACTIDCDDNGYTDVAITPICDASLFFDASGVRCTANPCTAAPALPVGVASFATCLGLKTGDICTPTCADGYSITLGSAFVLACNAGTFVSSAAPCGVAVCPDNAITPGTCACDAANGFAGTPVWSAADAKWTHTCVPVQCGTVTAASTVANVDYTDCSTKATGDVCTVYCDEGFLGNGQVSSTINLVCVETAPGVFEFNGATGLACTASTCPVNSAAANAPCAGCVANFVLDMAQATWDRPNQVWLHSCLATCAGAIATVPTLCPTGYSQVATPASTVCTTSSIGSCTQALCCVPNQCGATPVAADVDAQGVYTSCTNQITGATCSPTCNAGYTPTVASIQLVCIVTTTVYASPMRCTANSCSAGPKTGGSAYIDYATCNALTTAATCTPTCNTGYTQTGTTITLNCESDGYDATGITCTPTTCTTASNPDPNADAVNGYTGCTGLSTGQTCVPRCATGFVVTGSSSIALICSPTFSVTGSSCTLKDCPTNGVRTATPGECICGTGYTGTLVWSGLEWTGICSAQACVASQVPNSVSYSATGSLNGNTGDVISAPCMPGFQGNKGSATCLAGGTFDLPICTGQPCNQQLNVQNALIPAVPTSGIAEQQVAVTCNTGFTCSVVPCVSTCQGASLTWSDISCTAIACPTNGNTPGTCTCNSGYIAVPAVSFDAGLQAWTHTCWASCGFHTCPSTLRSRLAPSTVQCTTFDVSSCDDQTCCVGITITPDPATTKLRTTEAGGTASFTVVLVGEPTSDVTISIASSATTEGFPNPAQLIFTPLLWHVQQTVEVRGVDDSLDDGDQDYTLTFTTTSLDAQFAAVQTVPMLVVNADDDEKAIVVELPTGLTELEVREDSATTTYFTVYLQSQPTADVSVTVTTSDVTEGLLNLAGGVPVGTTLTLVFTTVQWNVPQTVTVTGQNDDVDDGDITFTIVTGPAQSQDTTYNTLNPSDVSARCVDDDTRGFVITPINLITTESGTTGTFTLVLTSQPTTTVVTTLTSSDLTEGTLTPNSIAFSVSSWSTPATVTVTGIDDLIDDGDVQYTVITTAFSSLDPSYTGLNPDDVIFTNTDDDTASIIVSPTSGLLVDETGATQTFTVKLGSEPTDVVYIEALSRDTTEGSTSATGANRLEFTGGLLGTWNTLQTITVTGLDDEEDDGDIAFNVTCVVVSSDQVYDGLRAEDVVVINADNDTANIIVTPTSGLITTEAGGFDNFTIYLASKPTDSVSIDLTSSDSVEGAVSPRTVIFTPSNWNVPMTIVVTGADEFIADGNQTYSISPQAAVTTDTKYTGMVGSAVTVLNIDDDVADILVDPVSGLITTERNQKTDQFTVVLTSQPTADVTIPITSSDLTEGTLPLGITELVFTAITWNVPQRITVTGVDDTDRDGDIAYNVDLDTSVSLDTNYNGNNRVVVSVTNQDDDIPGVLIQPNSSLITKEKGGTGPNCGASCGNDKFDVSLTSIPIIGKVVVFEVTVSDTTEAGIQQGALLTFDSTNWNQRVTVEVNGLPDSIDDGDIAYDVIITLVTTGSNPTTDANFLLGLPVTAFTVSATNIDEDTAGIVVSPTKGVVTSEVGSSQTVEISLASKPVNDVYVRLNSDETEGELTGGDITVPTSQLLLKFTELTWNVPTTVTVKGVDDWIDDGDITYNVTIGPVTSADVPYNGMRHLGFEVLNTDDDTAGITVTLPVNNATHTVVTAAGELITKESETTNSFAIVLDTQPTAQVTVWATTTDITEGRVSPGSVIFTPLDWNITQWVRVTGENDFVQDGNVPYTVTLGPVHSTDLKYSVLTLADVKAVNYDDDTADIFISGQATGNASSITRTSEDGQTVEYTVALKSEPTADVVLGITSTNLLEGTVLPATLTFTYLTWGDPQTITVTGVDDFFADGTQNYGVDIGPAISTDTYYSAMSKPQLSIENLDNDVAGFTVSPVSGLSVAESKTTTTFTVVLDTMPLSSQGNIDFTIVSQDTTELTVDPATISFTQSNWNTPFTITVTGVPDDTIEKVDPIVAVRVQVSTAVLDTAYTTLPYVDVNITNIDIDSNGVRVEGTSLTVEEAGVGSTAGTATFKVILNSKPTHDVSISLSSGDTSEVTIDVSNIVLSANKLEQTVTVTALDDFIDDGDVSVIITTGAAISQDPDYNGLTSLDVTVVNIDNDEAGVEITYPNATRYETSETGSSKEFTVVLKSQPESEVQIRVATSDPTEALVDNQGTLDGAVLLLFQAGSDQWKVPQTVRVTGANDNIDDGDIDYQIGFAMITADIKYSRLTPAPVLMVNRDDDEALVVLTAPAGLLTTSEAGGWSAFTVHLNSQPSEPVQVTMKASDTTEGALSQTVLIFTAADWSTPQEVNVTGVDDTINDGDISYRVLVSSVKSNDQKYNGKIPGDIELQNIDDDVAGVLLRPGEGACYVVGGVNADKRCVFPFVHQGRTYTTCATEVFSNLDFWCATSVNDKDVFIEGSEGRCNPGCTGGITTTEGGSNLPFVSTQGSFTIQLTSTPTHAVTITLDSDDDTEGLINLKQLVFPPAAWNVPQSIIITAVDDNVADGNKLYTIATDPCRSTDVRYNGIVNPPDVVVNNTDDDIPGVLLSLSNTDTMLTTEESGTTAQFTVMLQSQPLSGVSMSVNSTDVTEGMVNPQYLLFTEVSWNVPQTITVTGIADNIQDGDQTYYVRILDILSADGRYSVVTVPDVRVQNIDQVDECVDNLYTCLSAGQTCNDPNKAPTNLGDWECVCQGDSTGTSRGTKAVCPYTGECITNAATCTEAGQLCKDLGSGLNNWQCECPSPTSGVPVFRSITTCTLDECDQNRAQCEAVGQVCTDPDTSFSKLNDWMCVCPEPQTGSQLTGVATCEWKGECKSRFSICTALNQTCNDPDVTLSGDWECVCLQGVGRATAKAAVCTWDECADPNDNAKVCKDLDQVCRDPNPTPEIRGDWVCECHGSNAQGTGSQMPATCLVDECLVESNLNTCLDYGQLCVDPDMSPSTLDDWRCECVLPATGSNVGAKADCIWGGECANTANRNVCINPTQGIKGQTCNDPNPESTGDWQCQCVSPYRLTIRTGAPATCVLDECDTNRKTCTDAGQTCLDPNTDPISTGDWMCMCGPQSIGQAVTQPAQCAFQGECVENAPTCTAAGQSCVDPNIQAAGDWQCVCVSPQVGNQVMGVAQCSHDECLEFGQICRNYGQECMDPTPNPGETDDWTCNCIPPSSGSARARPAPCSFVGECTTNSGVCTTRGQTCRDPNVNKQDDWECACIGNSIGIKVGNYSTDCELDECLLYGHICTTNNQICVDRNKNTTSIDDWGCSCTGGQEQGFGLMRVASCALDECLSAGQVCQNDGQRCLDPNTDTHSTGDWLCVCQGSSTGQAVGQIASCRYTPECTTKQQECGQLGMTCVDPEETVTGDTRCQCVYPRTHSAANDNTCELDECILYGDVCIAAGQECKDLDKGVGSLNNWVCQCLEAGVGSEVGAPAVCSYQGECAERHVICTRLGQACFEDDINRVNDWGCICATDRSQSGRKYGGTVDECSADDCLLFDPSTNPCGDQRCEDPNTALTSRGDWKCICTGSDRVGEAVAQRAVCVLDECIVNEQVCASMGQVCVDPQKDPSSTGNWQCECVSPSSGTSVGMAKPCTFIGECIEHGPTCEASGQTCNDPNPTTQSGDWECVCVGKLSGKSTGRAAECILDECMDNKQVCNAVGQICIDPDPSVGGRGNWECRCVTPAQGKMQAAPATCEHTGECVANAITCSTAGQACRDPDLLSVGDWECLCIGDMEGRRTGGPATCLQDECISNRATCSAVGQTCQDPSITTLGTDDWQCDCVGVSSSGSQRGGVALCQWQGECATNFQTCTNVGQTCSDPSVSVTGDWRCECVFPEVGTRQGKAAPCVLDECLQEGLVCASEGQSCIDQNTNPLSLGDWKCICEGSSTGEAVKAIAMCEYEGECVANAIVCTKAGQYCRDKTVENLDDWECRCVSPYTGGAAGAATVCSYDECQIHGQLCSNAGQVCVDPDMGSTSRGDWECRCDSNAVPVRTEPYIMRLAECRYGGECQASNIHTTCTAAGQTCIDTNTQETDNWECSCVSPRTGAATKRAATCSLNECAVHGQICTSVGQRCIDPKQEIDSLNDWTCECQGSDETGSAVGRAASCVLNECNILSNWDVCAKAGQLCTDPNQDPRSKLDWQCECGGSGSGSSVRSPAECQYSGECAQAFQTCSRAGQICVDKDSLTDTWECQCVPPYTGNARASVAVCAYDECLEKGTVCETAEQRCYDPNTSPSSRDDWRCECLPPLTGTGLRQVATCSYVGECISNAVVCKEKGQTCTDPDTTKLNDWACICIPPQSGANSTGGVAICILDECIQYGETCTVVGQACVDPDTTPESTDDWVCKCVAPGKGSARGIAAQCAYTTQEGGECVQYSQICADAGQACNDPDVTKTGDWECVCVPPTVGRGVAATTICVLDECVENSFVCSTAGQQCNDPNKSPNSVGDWTCECQGSGTGTSVRSVATCIWSGECEVAHTRCLSAGQTCFDPTMDAASSGDWKCMCVDNQLGSATASIATCTFDECGPMGSICTYAGQTCVDRNTSVTSMGDWECRCNEPSSGSAIASTAVCVLDECGYAGSDLGADGVSGCTQCEANRAKCAQSSQTCRDPDATKLGDWECVCTTPQVGSARGVVATCSYDECLKNSGICSSKGQICVDPVKSISSLNDWQCQCQGSGTGQADRGPATCQYVGDCLRNSAVCTAAGQACFDPNPLLEGDWQCHCVGEQTGEASKEVAQCIQDECATHALVCGDQQVCLDPDTRPASTGDWACRCTGDAVGVAKTRSANCVLDECVKYGVTCYAAGQVCLDPNTSPSSTGDWTCKCTGSSSGQARALVATCAYTGECASNADVCTAQAQTCHDPSTRIGDWVCRCVDPATGTEGLRQPATCTLDECERVGTLCSNRGQRCRDPNSSPLSRGDWTCECQGSGQGSAIATPATCTYTGECLAQSQKCTTAGQACADSGVAAGFECVCVGGATGRSSGGVAPCTLDECVANGQTCTAASQSCLDPNKDFTSLQDWKCLCVGSKKNATGTAVGKPATCTVDECDEKKSICTAKGQICFDPNKAETSENDWTCTCIGSGSSEPKNSIASAASCVYSGECNANSGQCEAAGQTCIDPDQRDSAQGDWLCSCVPPKVGQMIGGVATCVYDECIEKSEICTSVGQKCVDKNTDENSLGDWECQCLRTTDAKQGGPANCNFLGECVTNSITCTASGQNCVDPNVDNLGDWQCECVSPQSGSPAPVGTTTCTHDECTGNSQAFQLCHSQGQRCVDINPSPESLDDWRCVCEGSSTGFAIGTLAECTYVGECEKYSGVCTSAGQTCSDPDPANDGDWECVCVSPAVGKSLASSATCELDECPLNRYKCGNQQTCRDPNPTSSSLDDWLCECQVGSGTSQGTQATCIVNECADPKVSSICTNKGQTCSDPTPSNDVKVCLFLGSNSTSSSHRVTGCATAWARVPDPL